MHRRLHYHCKIEDGKQRELSQRELSTVSPAEILIGTKFSAEKSIEILLTVIIYCLNFPLGESGSWSRRFARDDRMYWDISLDNNIL